MSHLEVLVEHVIFVILYVWCVTVALVRILGRQAVIPADVQVAEALVVRVVVVLVVMIAHHVPGRVLLVVLTTVLGDAEENVQIPAPEVVLAVMVVKARAVITPALTHAKMVVLQYVWRQTVVVAGGL